MISSDNIEGGRMATRELLEQGCSSILAVSSRENISVYAERFEGYAQVMRKHGLKPHVTMLDRLHYQDAYDEMNRILDSGEFHYDGIFAEADWLALGCYKALVEHGYRVPEQVKVAGFDDISITAFNAVPITTLRQQVDVIGKLAAEHLLRIINEEEISEKVIRVPVFLVPRESTRGPQK
jgi:LacI family transcriptional regulator